MKRLKQHLIQTRQHQRGAVAIIVGISIVILVAMLGLVVDLGHLYVAKSELQNAADAAALSGAKELNGTVAGVTSARDRAIEAAGLNKYDLNSTAVTLTAANLSVGNCPQDSCMVPISTVTTVALASNKTFLKVDTGLQNFNTWFIQVLPGACIHHANLWFGCGGALCCERHSLGCLRSRPTYAGRCQNRY